jgi:hypothetical protein
MRFADAAASRQDRFLLHFPDSSKIARNPALGQSAFSRRFRVIIFFFQQYPCRISRVFAGSRNRHSADPAFLEENAVFFADFLPTVFEQCGFTPPLSGLDNLATSLPGPIDPGYTTLPLRATKPSIQERNEKSLPGEVAHHPPSGSS